ncbi:MAG: hypothetical protein ACI9J3_002443 [Parvicellaceae bacterium]|jgi:hypothetical protein
MSSLFEIQFSHVFDPFSAMRFILANSLSSQALLRFYRALANKDKHIADFYGNGGRFLGLNAARFTLEMTASRTTF